MKHRLYMSTKTLHILTSRHFVGTKYIYLFIYVSQSEIYCVLNLALLNNVFRLYFLTNFINKDIRQSNGSGYMSINVFVIISTTNYQHDENIKIC